MADLFTFDRDEAEDILSGENRALISASFDDTADEFHCSVEHAQHEGVISGPEGASISVYPEGQDEPTPLLAVNDGHGLVLLGGELDWPEDELGQDEYTCELLANMVNAANILLLTLRERTHPPCTPQEDGKALIYVYSGPAMRLLNADVRIEEGSGEWETIAGSFRLLCWLPFKGAVIGNGESPETIWATRDNPERA